MCKHKTNRSMYKSRHALINAQTRQTVTFINRKR